MKIVIITDDLATGGAEKQIVLSASVLTQQGEDVEIILYNERNDYQEILDSEGVKVVKCPMGRHAKLQRLSFITKYLKQGQFDVVHAFKGNASVYGAIAGRLADIPGVFCGYRDQNKPGRLQRTLIRTFGKGATGWIVNSEGVKKTVSNNFRVLSQKVHVVRNAICPTDLESSLTQKEAKIKFGVSPELHVVVMIANFRPMKNHEMFFNVVREVRRLRQDVHFLLVGHGPKLEEVMTLRENSGLSEAVSVIGYCKEVNHLLRAADALILTSHTNTEGLPNVILEAGAARLPCVSTINGAEEIIDDGNTGFIVSSNDHAEMARKIMTLLDNPALREKLGLNAQRLCLDRYSPEKLYESLVSVYRLGLNT